MNFIKAMHAIIAAGVAVVVTVAAVCAVGYLVYLLMVAKTL